MIVVWGSYKEYCYISLSFTNYGYLLIMKLRLRKKITSEQFVSLNDPSMF